MLEIIQGLNSGSALILAVLVFANPLGFNKRGNFFIGLFLFILFAQLFDEILEDHLFFEQYPHSSFLFNFLLLAAPSLLFLAIRFYIYPNEKFGLKHLAPLALPILFIICCFLIMVTTGEIHVLNREHESALITDFYSTLFLLFIINFGILWFLGQRLLRKHKANTLAYSAAGQTVDLAWLRTFHWVYLLMIVTWISTVIIPSKMNVLIANIIYLIGTFLIAYHSIKQKPIYAKDKVEESKILQFIKREPKLNFEEESIDPLYENVKSSLDELMEREKIFLDNEINLAKLAAKLDTTPHILSATINKSANKNFSNYINDYRIKEAKQILTDPDKHRYTMLQVAYDAGFNSKTVFNTYFKKSTGLSPTAFKKQAV